MTRGISRRRFIHISGAAAGLALAGPAASADAAPDLMVWRGTMLGAVATMKIHHPDRREAERLVSAACTEARRLERLFSLYLEDSALVQLNRSGILVDPAAAFVELLAASLRYAEMTGGKFDPTVQPLWELYAGHFAKPDADPAGPATAAIEAARARVGHRRVSVSRDRIVLTRGTSLTLNGIAQGYITDKVVDLLRAEGIGHTLVDMGESRAIGARPDGRPWQVGIADAEMPGRTRTVVPIVDRAVSTSGSYGFTFDAEGRFNHLFDPSTGACGHLYRSVTTIGLTATAADALSTAFSLIDRTRIPELLPRTGIERVVLVDADGTMFDLVA
jgi:thiamine biosynthesis lipoprotein